MRYITSQKAVGKASVARTSVSGVIGMEESEGEERKVPLGKDVNLAHNIITSLSSTEISPPFPFLRNDG
jgi:hypothetical protein